MTWVDLVILVLVGLAAVRGLRLGAVQQILSFGGFWLGLFLGALVAPFFAHSVSSPAAKAIIVIVTVLGAATIVGALGRIAGSFFSTALRRVHLGGVDTVLGVGVAVVATLLACWLVASFLVNSRWSALDSAIGGSRIVQAMDKVLPAPPELFSKVESYMTQVGFPVAFAGIPPQVTGKVTLPNNAQTRSAVLADSASTVEIEGRACGLILEGSGFVVAPGYVVTNAHVIAGERHTYVLEDGGQYPATPVLYDPKLDISLLRAPTFSKPPLKLDSHLVTDGTASIVMGYPEDGPFTYGTAGVMALYDARGLDIYGNTYVTRQIYGLKAIVRPGNSGGPLAEPNGTVIGVVFARSTTNSQVGYAIASPAVLSTISPALHDTARVSTMGCTNA